jgi:16S rRNA (adenine1518-N6/adenine1519-N6)-dimethyltransferase
MISVAILWIVNEEGEILLAQRAHHKAQDPGVWGTAAAGKLEPGESFDDAIVRETEEELGLTTIDYTPHFLFEKNFTHPDGELRKFGIYYAVLPKEKSSLIHVDANEVASFGWFTLESIEERMLNRAEELVSSANALWPEIFQALKDAKAL